jgi:hypothetical protein
MPTQKKLDKIWDISVKDVKICDVLEQGYDLFGVDFTNIFKTPSQNKKYRSHGVQLPDGNSAIGKRKPQLLGNNIWRTCVANPGSVLPSKLKFL